MKEIKIVFRNKLYDNSKDLERSFALYIDGELQNRVRRVALDISQMSEDESLFKSGLTIEKFFDVPLK